MKRKILINLVVLVSLFIFVVCSQAQTSTFVYQGKLQDGSLSANGSYQFEVKLYDAASGGNQVGQTITDIPVTVSDGIFAVNLDFGAAAFDGAARFLEISVRLSNAGLPYTPLNPREPVTSTPYALKSLKANDAVNAETAANSNQLGGIPAAAYVQTTDSRMADSRTPLPNSTFYVQNGTNLQAVSNFNISGNGTAGGTLSGNAVNAATQYNIGGSRVLSTSNFYSSVFAGVGAGASNGPFGSYNSFFGQNAGQSNVSGANNSFSGQNAGQSNVSGANNSFFGQNAGQSNISGANNSFVGQNAGRMNTASNNTFVGSQSGSATTSSGFNTFVGSGTGSGNITGTYNTILGANANVSKKNLTYATAIGAGAVVTDSNTISIGRAGQLDVTVINGHLGVKGNLNTQSLGAGTINALNITASGDLSFNGVGGGSTPLCRTWNDIVRECSSSQRYKNNIQTFSRGLDLVSKLRPVTFTWIDGGMDDVGFVAEEVNSVEPLLSTYNKEGKIEGVKYAQITTALVNAVKEQQTQIEAQQIQIDALKALVCSQNPAAPVCKVKK